ncbi:MAG: M48 family metallopeptidase [Burkholderiaceae bacterium]|nr:M48 family metallopeptidase [Burkholderiaceae bacterium]
MTTTTDFDPQAHFEPDAATAAWHRHGCGCARHSRRLFGQALLGAGASLAVPAWAREGVQVDNQSTLAKLVPAEEVESAAAQQYQQMLKQAAEKKALAPADHPQVVRLRAISQRLIPFSNAPNLRSTARAANWKWEVNLIGSKQINAFCMPGGKIAFYYGILDTLQLSDDEVAQVMGHEIAHALREHARERMGKSAATRGAIELGAALLGLGGGGRYLADMGGQLLTMKFGRDDESEADKIGLDLAARAGYDPRAGVRLWQKMGAANKGAPPQWLSTHPAGTTRIKDLEANIPAVEGFYARADKPTQRFEPPKPSAS